jgi:hypothetical protein
VPERYGKDGYGNPSNWTLKDMTFGSPRPSRETLTKAERYMLAGAEMDGKFYQPWYLDVLDVVRAYESQTGIAPRSLSSDVMTTVIGSDWANSRLGKRLVSPISGKLPALNAESFSAGDLYIRPLSADEVNFYASPARHSRLFEIVKDGKLTKRLEDGTYSTRPVALMGKVWYVRMYGIDKTIYENIIFSHYDK